MVVGLYVSLAVFFNLKFLDGSNVNYSIAGHDEYLTIREVYSILQPLSWKHFFMAIISGDILYYGRLMFYSDAVVAFLPYKIFGLSGLVFSVRMFHAVLVLGGVWILGSTLIKHGIYRLFFIVTSLFTYYSFYFMMLPKPEPHQLFVLALFINGLIKNKFKPGFYFIYLGLAYGLKFNAILLIPVVFCWILANSTIKLRDTGVALVSFIAGLLIAVPCLVLSPVKPVFLQAYLKATFLNTTNVDDNPANGVLAWIYHVWPTYYSLGLWVFLITGMLIIYLLLSHLRLNFRKWISSPAVLMILFGLALNLPVVITTKRLYPHYLWTGQIFIWAGLYLLLAEHRRLKNLVLVPAVVLMISGVGYSVRSFNKMLTWEDKAKPLMTEVMEEQQAIFSRNTAATVVEDISVYFPFKWHVQAKPYHPFAGPSPAGVPEKQIFWTSLIDTVVLSEKNPDYIFMGRSYISIIKEPMNYSDSQLVKKLNDHYMKVKNSGNLVIWKKR